jgi:hypothetical protein
MNYLAGTPFAFWMTAMMWWSQQSSAADHSASDR